VKGLRGLIPSTADQFRRAGYEKRIKERNDGWLAVLYFLAWIYGASDRTLYLLCVCVYVHVGVWGRSTGNFSGTRNWTGTESQKRKNRK